MFKWKDSYSVNIEEVDKQHKRLFELGMKVFETAMIKDEYDHYDEIMKTLDELTDYTVYHFKFEEELFARYSYQDSSIHKMEHDFFVKKLNRIARKDLEENQGAALNEILEFLADWIAGHILKSDFSYREFFNSKGVC